MTNKNTKTDKKKANSPTKAKEVEVEVAEDKAKKDAGFTQLTNISLIRKGEAPKLRNTKQKIKYAIITLYQDPCIQLLANDGHGLFSDEPVPINAIQECLTGKVTEKPFSSRILHQLFNQQSNNNAGFLAAVLRQEGILESAPKKHFLHQLSLPSEQIAATLTK